MRVGRTIVGMLGLTAVLATGCAQGGGDRGMVGRWKRDKSEREISIARDGDGWIFCQAGTSGLLRERTECVDGRASEVHRGVEIVYEYTYEVEARGEDELRVRVRGKPLTQQDSPVETLEQFRVSADGSILWRWTLGVDGRRQFPPRGPFRYRRLSNRPYR